MINSFFGNVIPSLCLVSTLLFASIGRAQNNSVTIDFMPDVYGEIAVSHTISGLSESDNLLIFPAIVPGMYEQDDFGKYIHNLKVIYNDGTEKQGLKKDVNAFELENPMAIKRVEYTVKHTRSENVMHFGVFEPGGTYFNDTAYYMLNFHAIIGYFKNHQNAPYEVKILKGEHEGSGALSVNSTSEHDIIKAKTYDELVDNPFLYSQFKSNDISRFNVNNMEVEIAVYSENPLINALYLEENIRKIVRNAAENPLLSNYLPPKYCFLFYFDNRKTLFQGALEHKSSSVYYSLADTTGLLPFLSETISHEFMHILTPLNLHSDLITPYNFYNPKTFSSHLWLYEGITEYMAFKNNLGAGLTDTSEFFLMLNNKSRGSRFYRKRSMIKCSQTVLKNKSQNYYSNYYEKGALVGFYLDYLINKESKGTKNLSSMLQVLLEKYGQNKPFKDEALIPEIIQSFPETKVCFKNCVYGRKNVPLNDLLAQLDVTLEESEDSIKYEYWSYGFRGMSYSSKEGCFMTSKSKVNKETGIKKLKIFEVNGSPASEVSFIDFFDASEEDMVIKVEDNGGLREVTVKSFNDSGYYHPTIAVLPEEASSGRKEIRSLLRF